MGRAIGGDERFGGPFGRYVGARVGMTLGMTIGVHVANRGCGDFLLTRDRGWSMGVRPVPPGVALGMGVGC